MYYRENQISNFSELLSEAVRDEHAELRIHKLHLFENKKERIRAINTLAGHQLHMMESESDLESR